MRCSPPWPNASASARSSPRGGRRAGGWCTCTRSGPTGCAPTARGIRRRSARSGRRVSGGCPNRPPSGRCSRSSGPTRRAGRWPPQRPDRAPLRHRRGPRPAGLPGPPGLAGPARAARHRRRRASSAAAGRQPARDPAAQPTRRRRTEPVRQGGRPGGGRTAPGRRRRPRGRRRRPGTDLQRPGACLAGARLTDRLRPGVVRLPTGAWFDPVPGTEPPLCAHGNPNVLTADEPSSRLSQGCTGQHALVEIERWSGGEPPPVTVRHPPVLLTAPAMPAPESTP
ncbi:molybdopterin dinucleotide binding domain-containing protein [Kitasatospora paranensis]|uniref:molybdopterin dinucleotide binding domain-containing protein n=1 Tax=Kitasatospora paranensis TaxID=258053 RepID=UPI003CD07F2C